MITSIFPPQEASLDSTCASDEAVYACGVGDICLSPRICDVLSSVFHL